MRKLKVLKWLGAKWSIADKIIELMPKHKIYLEPFFGSGAVFFQRLHVTLRS
ncbi:DNA adenine methylase [Clostridium kluyveri]|uniref:DNA adenine methylase n=1 Tax=Clostridium kluyveri TaxID=1534 RepID=UPI003BF90A28